MGNKQIINILVLLIVFLYQPLQGQTAVFLEFAGNKKQIKETKKILKRHEVYFKFTDSFIKIDFTKKDTIYVPNIYIEKAKSKKFILIKLVGRKQCYYSLLSINFYNEQRINNIFMYRIQKKKHFFGNCSVMIKTKDLGSEISTEVDQSKITIPIYMIPCKRYNGEFEERTKIKTN